MQPWDLQRVGIESWLSRWGQPQTPESPQTCSLQACTSSPLWGYRALPEGRGHASSISLYLEELGEAQDKRVAVQVGRGGSAYTFGRQLHASLVCQAVFVWPSMPQFTLPHPAPGPGRLSLWTVSAGLPCLQASRWVCPTGRPRAGAQAASLRGCRMTAGQASTQGQPTGSIDSPVPCPSRPEWYHGCRWPSQMVASLCSFPLTLSLHEKLSPLSGLFPTRALQEMLPTD